MKALRMPDSNNITHVKQLTLLSLHVNQQQPWNLDKQSPHFPPATDT